MRYRMAAGAVTGDGARATDGSVMPGKSGAVRRVVLMRIGFGELLEVFLVSAISCLLLIRFFLAATGYPQLGGGGLHIAHMLWGGLGMLVALILVFVSISRGAFFTAAFLGGLGFGAFIDEIGKFVTSNNDYFYRPAIAMIYVAFVLVYLAGRLIEEMVRPSSQTYLANALEILKEAAARQLNTEEKQRAHAYLEMAGEDDPLAGAIADVLDQVEAVPVAPPGRLTRLARAARSSYLRFAQTRFFTAAMVWFFVVASLVTLVGAMLHVSGAVAIVLAAIIVLAVTTALIGVLQAEATRRPKVVFLVFLLAAGAAMLAATLWQNPDADYNRLSFVDWCDLISAIAVGLVVIVGVWQLRVSRLAAYRWFLRAILIEIFFAQVFAFYRDQLWAMVGLILCVIIWCALHYAMHLEEAATPVPLRERESRTTAVQEPVTGRSRPAPAGPNGLPDSRTGV